MTNELQSYMNSLNEIAYIGASEINKLINGKSLTREEYEFLLEDTREEYELLLEEKIKSLKEENIKELIPTLKKHFTEIYENNQLIEGLMQDNTIRINLIYQISENLIHLHGETFND